MGTVTIGVSEGRTLVDEVIEVVGDKVLNFMSAVFWSCRCIGLDFRQPWVNSAHMGNTLGCRCCVFREGEKQLTAWDGLVGDG